MVSNSVIRADGPQRSLVSDARRFSLGWRAWFWLLLAVNLVGPLFFLSHPEAWVVVLGYALSAAVMVPLHRRMGWVRLLGVAHFPWLVILPWLTARLAAGGPMGALGAWLVAVLAVDGVCLIIDAVDVGRYLAGERRPLVAGARERSR